MTQEIATRRGSTIVVVVLVACFGGLLFGYDTAVINGANEYLKVHFRLDSGAEGSAGSSAILGCIPGAMVAGFLSDRFGRRKVLFLCAILYAVSGVLSAVPRTFDEFLAARFLSGLAIGASSMICPVYVAEISPKEWRGRLGSLFQLGIVTGIFVTLYVNREIQGLGDAAWNSEQGWRWMLAAEVAPAVALFATLFVVPESPRWLLKAGHDEAARRILQDVGGPAHAEAEVAAVRDALSQEEGRFSELLSRACRRPLLVAVLLMAVSQFSGINAIMYYSTKIFRSAGVGVEDSFTSSAWIGFVNVIFTFVAIALVDKAGRRWLLIVGLAVQVVALGLVGWMFHAGSGGLGLLAGIVVYIAAFAMGLGPIPWILCSEIFPTKVRGRAMSVATLVIWSSCWIVAKTFPALNDRWLGPAITFWIYGACSLLGLLFVLRMVPETKGRSLEEIERSWR
jgi:SP family arabinose:H+ symporter-like MFS transporter